MIPGMVDIEKPWEENAGQYHNEGMAKITESYTNAGSATGIAVLIETLSVAHPLVLITMQAVMTGKLVTITLPYQPLVNL